MLRILSTIIVFLCFTCAQAQLKWNSAYQAYIDRYSSLAVDQMNRYGIPASITLAQGLLESGAGKSSLATEGNNHFGIKCHDWTGKKMYRDDDKKNDCFRVYNSVWESYEDHSKFLKRPHYSRLFTLKLTDYKGWAKGLKACGYATSPTYAQNLINVIELYKLYNYDTGKAVASSSSNVSGGASKKTGITFTPVNKKMPVKYAAVSATHQIRYCNKNYYVIARAGDTFASIAEEVGSTARKLARYNERDRRDRLEAGDIIYLQRKRSKADKSFKHKVHVVKSGESLYDISQRYGIRLNSLYRKNKLTFSYSIKVGEQLRVY